MSAKKKDAVAENRKGPGTKRYRMSFVRSSANGQKKDSRVELESPELPLVRLGKLISAAVRVWELKRGIRPTCWCRLSHAHVSAK